MLNCGKNAFTELNLEEFPSHYRNDDEDSWRAQKVSEERLKKAMWMELN